MKYFDDKVEDFDIEHGKPVTKDHTPSVNSTFSKHTNIKTRPEE
jgi:hypothetical protein